VAKPVVRLGAVQLAFAIGAAIILVRAAQVQLISGARYATDAESERTEHRTQEARRGFIYDRNGEILVESVDHYHVAVTASVIPDSMRGEAVQLLIEDLGLSRTQVNRQLRRTNGYFRGPFTSAQVQRLRSIPGIRPRAGEQGRFHPNGRLAAAILGRTAADGVKADGLELVFDTVLTGVPGSKVLRKDPSGRTYESPARFGPHATPGHDLYLTLDVALQEIVEYALDDALQRFDAERGDVVVLDPQSGEILALASRTIDGDVTAKAVTDPFEPGSTAKVFTAAALLTGGQAGWSDSVWAEMGEWKTEHRTIKDEEPHGYLTLAQVIEQSSNIGIVKFARRLESRQQYLMLRDFGLGARTGIEYPSESDGVLNRPHKWSGISGESMAMGYELSVTPLQLAQAYAAIANDGLMMRPTLIRSIVSAEGEILYRHRPEPVRRVVSAELARELRQALRGVVYGGGTGEKAALEGYEVAGKTGTAKRAGGGGYVEGAFIASFTSLFPADDPQIVTVVKLDNPKAAHFRFGSTTAAPVTKAVLERLLAAETGALDRAPLARPVASELGSNGQSRTIPATSVIVAWPDRDSDGPAGDSCSVPDVRGLSLRAAARQLHELGLRMQLTGWGIVRTTDPLAGTVVPQGATVRVGADDSGTRR
jgi:cell division protein FtsI (penicillin-binding protein 3)